METLKYESEKKTLNVNEIVKDHSIYPRENIDENRIIFFTDLMREGTIFPRIKVVKDESGKYILLDGFHRCSAFKNLKKSEVHCELINAEPKMWRLLSVRFNFDSSQPLKFGEIRKAIYDTWCKDNMRDKQQIADVVGCSVQWVRKVVRDLALDEEGNKLALARKIKNEENASIRDIAERVGWTKSKTHRLLNGVQKSVVPPSQDETQQDKTTISLDAGEGSQRPDRPAFDRAERIIENFDSFGHTWEPDQKETLYAIDGIKNGLLAEDISKYFDKNPAWVRNTAQILLYLFQNDENQAGRLSEISETLSVNIERTRFIHWLFTHWPNTLPKRKFLFQWILANQSPYRDKCVCKVIRFEHLYWNRKNIDTEEAATDEGENHILKELPPEELSELGQIIHYFEGLKKYIRNYKIETALAKDLLEHLNLIMISQNRIRDHLQKYI